MGDNSVEKEKTFLVGLYETPVYRVSRQETAETGVVWTISPAYDGIASRPDDFFKASRYELMKIVSSSDPDMPRGLQFRTDAWITMQTWSDQQLAITLFARALWKEWKKAEARYRRLAKICAAVEEADVKMFDDATEDAMTTKLYSDRMNERVFRQALDRSDHCNYLYARVFQLYEQETPKLTASQIIWEVLHLNDNPKESRHGFPAYSMTVPGLASQDEVMRAKWLAEPKTAITLTGE